jgi:hypothetical protein
VLIDWNPDYVFNNVFEDPKRKGISSRTSVPPTGTKSRMPAAP